ncbi:N6-L-threonylcarbamoyladenine synthase [Nematocida parisii]|uniref:N(6)-L-threonylcarbamoyladenine synthase n=1 Tax=Nematocida parisii (strain ERTm3) TaxID=935791 RepID=I3EHA0_NEMP3|nr:0-sialoglycoprotein endopeptidase [Nematocida parisii ERTm3]KAI5130668.1 N6-L-threonylcarbamoyladenine synthase [Nematocida parisii]KAI5130694.1 N6-L-threonylcarbamoyladenine synthase [Nematocida parisii]KAI5145134.1 N6-L-threonylcarbamoyladenine synthase [Nematocida parisii]KAI5155068.1 N6-L-threonylcarbamoyladenine synthase [Nematocida parisii]
MLIVGLEGSANKLGVGIVNGQCILANERNTYVPPQGEGFKITEAAMHHQANIMEVFKRAVEKANIKVADIEYIAYTAGPGIGPCLQAVAVFAKVLSVMYNIPVVPVNHCVAHIEMGRFITQSNNPTILYVSGGNTQIIVYHNRKYKVYGETLDIAIGNCLDRLARTLNISNYPSPGYNIEQLAKKGTEYIKLPYIIKGMDVSFSGLLSYVQKYLQGKELTDELKANICYSVQETAFAMLVEVSERAMACADSNEILVVGGVGCNKRLQKMASDMAEQRGGTGYSADERYCIDNGLMIAHTAYKMISAGYKCTDNSCHVSQRYRTDTVDVIWRD